MTKNNIAEILFKTGRWAIFIAIITLIVRRNDLHWTIKRSYEILLAISFLMAVVWFFWTKNWPQLKSVLEKIYLPFLLIIGGYILATTINYFIHDIDLDNEAILNFFRLIVVFLSVILIKFYHPSPLALLANLIFLPALWINTDILIANKIAWTKFYGLENFPSNSGYLYLIILGLCFGQFIQNKNIFYYLLSLGAMAFVWWANARAAILGAIILLAVIIFLSYRHKVKEGLVLIFLAISVIMIGHQVLPEWPRKETVTKLWGIAINPITGELGAGRDINNFSAIKSISTQDSSRLYAGSFYIQSLIKKPWGLGAAYHNGLSAVGSDSKTLGPHNTILEILTLGGILALIGFIWLWYLALKNSFANKKFELVGVFAGLLTASMFDNMIVFKAWWVVLGFMLI